MKEISIAPIVPAGIAAPSQGAKPVPAASGFGELLNKSIAAVNEQMNDANQLAQGLISGQHANIHETMIAGEKAGISFRLMTRVQQKVLDAYQEVMRIQL